LVFGRFGDIQSRIFKAERWPEIPPFLDDRGREDPGLRNNSGLAFGGRGKAVDQLSILDWLT